MRKQFSFELGKNMFVFRITKSHGLVFSFSVYPFRNVIGISSKVDEDRHALFGDYEKELDYQHIQEAMVRNNVAYLCFFLSSPGKYHFMSPQVFSWLDSLNASKDLGAEKNYLSISAVRQEFILRISKKGKKDEPYPVVIFKNDLARNISYSSAHLDFMRVFYGLDHTFTNIEIVKSDLKVEKYKTTNI